MHEPIPIDISFVISLFHDLNCKYADVDQYLIVIPEHANVVRHV